MPIFRIEPIGTTVSDRRWTASKIKETFWIRADSEDAARHHAALILMQMTDVIPGKPVLFSPWLDSNFAECSPDDPAIEIPAGIIVTTTGKTYS